VETSTEGFTVKATIRHFRFVSGRQMSIGAIDQARGLREAPRFQEPLGGLEGRDFVSQRLDEVSRRPFRTAAKFLDKAPAGEHRSIPGGNSQQHSDMAFSSQRKH
jgi:hypothetical protein